VTESKDIVVAIWMNKKRKRKTEKESTDKQKIAKNITRQIRLFIETERCNRLLYLRAIMFTQHIIKYTCK